MNYVSMYNYIYLLKFMKRELFKGYKSMTKINYLNILTSNICYKLLRHTKIRILSSISNQANFSIDRKMKKYSIYTIFSMKLYDRTVI